MAAMAEAGVLEDEAMEDAMVQLVYVEMLYDVNLAKFDRCIGVGWIPFPGRIIIIIVRK
jgi:hypothetical protein